MSTTTTTTVNRKHAAAMLGIRPETLANWACKNPMRGPRPIKLGSEPQARVIYDVADLARWQLDPIGYETRRQRRSHRGPRR